MLGTELKIAVLGDSRTFDTYYYNANYEEHYGYDSTFHFLLRKALLEKASGLVEVIHIPDHFRGHSIENNILRLALTNPAVVVLCDGIWETLVSKELFIAYAVERINAHDTRGGETLELRYSSGHLAKLFVNNQLSSSPRSFLEKQRKVVSYFRRRRRQCAMMKLVIPDLSHLNRVHFAGNYRCIPEWDVCLRAINEGIDTLAEDYGALIIDTHDLAEEHGGFERNLIDQWHFSASFHKVLAKHLEKLILDNLDRLRVPPEHLSHKYIIYTDPADESLLVYGTGPFSKEWIRTHPKMRIEAVLDEEATKTSFQSIQVLSLGGVPETRSKIVLLAVPEEERREVELRLLDCLPREKIVLYPEELERSGYKSLKGM